MNLKRVSGMLTGLAVAATAIGIACVVSTAGVASAERIEPEGVAVVALAGENIEPYDVSGAREQR